MKLKLHDYIAMLGAFLCLTEILRTGTFTGHSLYVLLVALCLWAVHQFKRKPEKPTVHTVRRMVIIEKKGGGWSEAD